MNIFRKNNRAFTLIELLVVITIIGILATFAIANYSATRERARDTQRKSDLANYRTAIIKNSLQHNGLFRSVWISIDSVTDCNQDYLNVSPCPLDPLGESYPDDYVYMYTPSGPQNGAAGVWDNESFSLSTRLESIKDTQTYWVVCSNGKVGESTTRPLVGNECTVP